MANYLCFTPLASLNSVNKPGIINGNCTGRKIQWIKDVIYSSKSTLRVLEVKFCRTISGKTVQDSDVRPLSLLEDTLNYLSKTCWTLQSIPLRMKEKHLIFTCNWITLRIGARTSFDGGQDEYKVATDSDQDAKARSIICKNCDGNGAVLCSQCKGIGVNSVDYFSGRFKAGEQCWLCGGKKDMLCGDCNGAGFLGGFMSTFDE